jgi:hypothetical protein
MSPPFQVSKTFTTSLKRDEVINFVRERLNKQSKVLFISSKDYVGSINGRNFNLYKNFNSRYGGSNPKIKGTITTENPTTIDIKIAPHYLRIAFFMIFPIVFIPAAILSDQMTINGVLKEPEISERILFGLFGGGPMIWCYFDSIRPIKETELWIKQKLGLIEKTNQQI